MKSLSYCHCHFDFSLGIILIHSSKLLIEKNNFDKFFLLDLDLSRADKSVILFNVPVQNEDLEFTTNSSL